MGRSALPSRPQKTAPAAMPIFGYNRPKPKWPVARPSIWVLAFVCFGGGVRLAVLIGLCFAGVLIGACVFGGGCVFFGGGCLSELAYF